MSTISLKALTPIVVGCDYARTLQGNTPAGVAGTGFTGSETLTATLSLGQGLASVLSPTVAWSSASACQFVLSITAAQSAGLSIDATYYGLVEASSGGATFPIAAFYLPTLPSPSAQAAAIPPDLITVPYAAQLLAQLSLTEAQFEAIPTLITAASDAIRSWCNRRFDQGTVTEDAAVSLYGEIRLDRPPVNVIQRIQCGPRVALTASNATADSAWIYPAATGDQTIGVAITGIVLNWISAGAVSTSTITFADLADQRISTLATAIGAVGSGWSATADSTLGDWPISEIVNLQTGEGAGPDDQPYAAGQYLVYSQNLTNYWPNPDNGENTAIYRVGRLDGISAAMRWGPGGDSLWADGYGGGSLWPGRVRVTYNGGFAAVPREVQLACVELVKAQLDRLGTTLLLQSETAGEYSYTINPDQVMALPPHVLQGLSRYRITNA